MRHLKRPSFLFLFATVASSLLATSAFACGGYGSHGAVVAAVTVGPHHAPAYVAHQRAVQQHRRVVRQNRRAMKRQRKLMKRQRNAMKRQHHAMQHRRPAMQRQRHAMQHQRHAMHHWGHAMNRPGYKVPAPQPPMATRNHRRYSKAANRGQLHHTQANRRWTRDM